MSSTAAKPDDEEHNASDPSYPGEPQFKRHKIAIFFAYCGAGYKGMQKNPGAKTIEGDLEEALYLSGAIPEQERGQPKRFDFARSSRTDKGVSAVGQVVSGRFCVDPPGLVGRLNSYLPPQIRVFWYQHTAASFSAKKSCDRRRYIYLIPVFALDPSCHRDRESVLASVRSGNQLVKCLECSERGRKVVGAMGKRIWLKPAVESVDSDSGISTNRLGTMFEKNIALSSSEMDNGGGIGCNGSRESREIIENENNRLEKLAKSDSGCEIVNGSGRLEKKSEFSYGEAERERFNGILRQYEGTHNFHNFTTRMKADDPAAMRCILSFNANTVIPIDGIDFVRCEVVGQSFMLHQIRKMIGLALAIMRNCAPESLIQTAFQENVDINVPMAPEVGLYLDECFFLLYNQKWKDIHGKLSLKAYAEEAEEFKMKYIYPHIAAMEHKDGAVALWLHSLNYRNYPDLRGAAQCFRHMDESGPKTRIPNHHAQRSEWTHITPLHCANIQSLIKSTVPRCVYLSKTVKR